MSKRTKPPVDRRGLSFPAPLLDQIRELIKDDDRYRSVSEYIRFAISEKVGSQETTELYYNELKIRQKIMFEVILEFISPDSLKRMKEALDLKPDEDLLAALSAAGALNILLKHLDQHQKKK
ncbi:MAG: hypothetical protein JRI72_03990 [Deltaproteobacteria bacterium]|nr:hypothetical protein [Deltaproteobacteria bacterium]